MAIKPICIYEFDKLVSEDSAVPEDGDLRRVPPRVFKWLDSLARGDGAADSVWIRPSRQRGCHAVEVTSYVGVIRAPDGTQIEILPKIGKALNGGEEKSRKLLIRMLRCLGEFRHVQISSANLRAEKMPLLEVFIGEFLRATKSIAKRGLRSSYTTRQDNVFALRGKLQMASHLRQNLCRRDRFFAEFDEFSADRAENRLVHAALRRVLSWTSSATHQQLAQELCFVFADVPISGLPSVDFQRVHLDRGMDYYEEALAWARLILEGASPLTGSGRNKAPSLLFPMQDVFEAFVAKHLVRQLHRPFTLRAQARSVCLVKHREQEWFRLKPDILIQEATTNQMVLDTKWKHIDSKKSNSADKYKLSQSDFYQIYAYGHNYLSGQGDVVLIYPMTDDFNHALDKFEFPKAEGLRLWVLPFCLDESVLILPACGSLDQLFKIPGVPGNAEVS